MGGQGRAGPESGPVDADFQTEIGEGRMGRDPKVRSGRRGRLEGREGCLNGGRKAGGERAKPSRLDDRAIADRRAKRDARQGLVEARPVGSGGPLLQPDLGRAGQADAGPDAVRPGADEQGRSGKCRRQH